MLTRHGSGIDNPGQPRLPPLHQHEGGMALAGVSMLQNALQTDQAFAIMYILTMYITSVPCDPAAVQVGAGSTSGRDMYTTGLTCLKLVFLVLSQGAITAIH